MDVYTRSILENNAKLKQELLHYKLQSEQIERLKQVQHAQPKEALSSHHLVQDEILGKLKEAKQEVMEKLLAVRGA